MENALHISMIWLHVMGIALFVGPQVFLAFAWVPASRQIEDLPTRVKAMRTITRRFLYIGSLGLVMIIGAGSYLIADWRDYYGIPDDAGFTSLRFGVWFIIKMNVLIVMLIVTGLHTFVAGPRQLAKYEARARGEAVSEAELRSVRIQSMTLSVLGLALTLAIMVMGAMIGASGWAFQEA